MRIAILGATSHIAKGLIFGLHGSDGNELFLFARSPERVRLFLESIGAANSQLIKVKPFSEFSDNDYDAVINCVGIGNPARLANELTAIFSITETFDNLVLAYLQGHQQTLYINFSSGAAYGTDFSAPVDVTSQARFNINSIDLSEYYGIAKVNSEAKHRAMKDYNIVDLRVFSFFSRFIDLNSKFLLSEIISCVRNGKELLTDSSSIIRDYVHPKDLAALVRCCINKERINAAYDVCSLKPVTKNELLDYFSSTYNLKYRVSDAYVEVTVTGKKDNYYSISRAVEGIGFIPRVTSLDTIAEVSREILGSGR